MFETELQLVDLIEEVVPIVFVEENDLLSNFSVFREVNVGYGSADVVIADICCSCSELSLNLEEKDLAVLEMVMQKGKVYKNEVSESTRLKPLVVSKILKKLEDNYFLVTENDEVVLCNSYRKIVKKSIAIEAKLKNWSRALKQAYRYKCFANYSFVCLPSANAKPAIGQIDKFKEAGVGLMTIDELKRVTTIYSPPRICPFNTRMDMLFNELVKSSIQLSLEDSPNCVGGNCCSRPKEELCGCR